MDRLKTLRKSAAAAPTAEPVRLNLRVSQDVAEALAIGKVRGLGTMSEQVEALVRAREEARESRGS